MLTHELSELSQQRMPTDVSNQNKRLTTNPVCTRQCDTFTSTSTYGNNFFQISPQVRAPIDLVDENVDVSSDEVSINSNVDKKRPNKHFSFMDRFQLTMKDVI